MQLKGCVFPIIQISLIYKHNLYNHHYPIHTHTYTQLTARPVHPHALHAASIVYTGLTSATLAKRLMHARPDLLLHSCVYVDTCICSLYPLCTRYCSPLLHGLPLGIQLRTPCAETWRWHWCCVPLLFSAYCLSQSLRVSYLECCISTFLPYHIEEVGKDSVVLSSWQAAFWRWLQSIKLWLSRSLNWHGWSSTAYCSWINISGITMPFLDVTT